MRKYINKLSTEDLTEDEIGFLKGISFNSPRLKMASFIRNDYVTVWGIKKRKNEPYQMGELQRIYFNGAMLTSLYIKYSYLSGYNACFDEKGCNNGYPIWDEGMSKVLEEGKWYDLRKSSRQYYSEAEYLSKLAAKLPKGISVSDRRFKMSGARIETFIRCLPNSEFLLKKGGGMAKLAFSEAICLAPKENQMAIRKWLVKHERQISKTKTNHIPLLAEYDLEPNQFDYASKLHQLITTVDELKSVYKKMAFDMHFKSMRDALDYLESQEVGIYDYIHYLGDCDALGLDLSKGVARPRDLTASMTSVSKKRNAKDKKEVNSRIKKLSKLLGIKKLPDNLSIKPMDCVSMFIEIGNKLHMCVGKMGYDSKMAEGRSYCAVLFKGDEPQECCEIDRAGRILQLYGDHDRLDGEYHELAKTEFGLYAKERNGILSQIA